MSKNIDLLEYISMSHQAKDDDQLFSALKEFIEPFGFDSTIFCLMTDHPSIGEPAKHGKIVGYPEDWMKHYKAYDYENLDPIRKESLLQTQRVFSWEGIDKVRPYNKDERHFFNQASDAGLKNGVAVSLSNTQKESVAFGYASSSGNVDLTPVLLSILKLASIQFYDTYQSLKSRTNINNIKRIYLSAREREVLQWAAAGKSSNDIGVILNISERTVNFHIQQCFMKLEANSKTLAVVKAIRLGLITLDTDFKVIA